MRITRHDLYTTTPYVPFFPPSKFGTPHGTSLVHMLLLVTSLGWHLWPRPVERGPRSLEVPPAASRRRTPAMDMDAGRKEGDAATLLQLVSHTAMMEGMLRQQYKDIQHCSTPRHISLVTKRNPVIRTTSPVIRREDMLQSVSAMLRNSDLAAIPGGGEAADALASISGIAQAGAGPLSPDELVAIAGQYGATQAELQRVFEALPLAEQDQGRAAVGRPRPPMPSI